MERFAKEIPIGRTSRRKRLAQVVVKLVDRVGAMADINAIMARSGADIRQSATYTISGDAAVYNAFVHLKDSKTSLSDLVAGLKKSKFVLDAVAAEGVDGSLVDVLTFPITWAKGRVVVLSQEGMVKMFDDVTSLMGSGGALIIYEEGATYGRNLATMISRTVGMEFARKNFSYGLMLISATGWGVPEVTEADGLDNITVRIRESFECVGRKSKVPTSQFMRGFLAGTASVLLGKPLGCRETKCAATGDEYCEFELHRF